MKPFMDEHFLLKTPTAQKLYHEAAEPMPIYDYHCHLSAREIWENVRFRNLGHLMLGGDHYKWRAMLWGGVAEANIRGAGSDWDKFYAYASTLKYAIGNPLYHWTHLELRRVFGIEEILDKQSAASIWERANALLATDAYRCRALIRRFDVRLIGTTDSPLDDLSYHQKLAADQSFPVRVVPSFRPDGLIHIDRAGFAGQVRQLAAVCGMEIDGFDSLVRALESRVQYFHEQGARISDHALDQVPYGPPSLSIAREALGKVMRGEPVGQGEIQSYKTCVLLALARMYQSRGWVMQYHIGAMRNNNRRMFEAYGPDVGFDSMDDLPVAHTLSRLLSLLEEKGCLPKTILYSLNPKDNLTLATLAGNFQGDGIPGKIQLGSAWWFNDTLEGMRDQLRALASVGLLGRFVGMLTDSRSFISYPRHEYFRRILCDLFGDWVEAGEYPNDPKTLKKMIRGICYDNAVRYFGIPLHEEEATQ